ncbi:helix-turn-helix transcriptional regulator [Nakamurella flavida]|uniref:Helix-turn-helix transcriptional regulator n=2 Tax=Nakamurella flavida TaxID=363630 RepID=A0A939C3Q2_9ACTN|nr:helix-turn-helix transcriptional regulator [Nakamurella flavida]
MLRCAPDVARIALTRWDPDLAGRVAGDVAALPTTRIPLLAATPDLVGGMASGSVDQLVAAAEAATRAGNVPLAATAQEELAYAAGSAGRADIARPTLDLAVAAYQGMGARAGADRASARLRTVGIRRGSRAEHRTDRRGPASLTPTERRVTLLVRDGLTNPEIAARLFLSPRTVQTHVSHILAKLGARSRVEVARMDLPPGGVEG